MILRNQCQILLIITVSCVVLTGRYFSITGICTGAKTINVFVHDVNQKFYGTERGSMDVNFVYLRILYFTSEVTFQMTMSSLRYCQRQGPEMRNQNRR